MNNEPDLKLREELIIYFNSKKFEELLNIITNLQKRLPKSIFLLTLSGNVNHELKNYTSALKNFETILEIQPNFAEAHYNLGIIFRRLNQIDKSLKHYRECIKINPKKFEAYNNLGNIYRSKHKIKLAIQMYLQCLEINSNYVIALQNFGICLQNYKFSKQSDLIEKNITNLLNQNRILRPVDIIDNIIDYLYLSQNFNFLIKNLTSKDDGTPLDESINIFLNNKILIKLLQITPITDIKIENALKSLRRKILLNFDLIKNRKEALQVIGIIASQCFINEYIYPIQLEEKKILSKLEQKILNQSKDKNLKKYQLEISCIAAYKPLYSFKWSKKITDFQDIFDLVKLQIINPEKEIALRNKLKSKTISNIVSIKVRDQYENSPYPRWEKVALNNNPKRLIDYAQNLKLKIKEDKIKNWRNLQVLVAGCGTGQHAITTATKYKDSYITAIDLSKNSLSYAKRKADELGVKNINFIQMDLLDLKNSNKSFDLIESVGVLHHMDSPFNGWKTLCDILKTDGLIMIGLYSKIARSHIEKIRAKIKKLNIEVNKQNVIEFREKIISSNDKNYDLIKKSSDFYSLSNLIDLLFHIKEHRFSIPKIEDYIKKLNLKFCGFENTHLLNYFEENHKNTNDIYNLDLWNKFEVNNPRIFAGMYQFWCQKK